MSANAKLAVAVDDFAAAWSRRDAAGVLALWDLEDGAATYLPAGSVQPMIGATAIRRYVTDACETSAQIVMRPSALHLRAINPDLGLAFFKLAWVIREATAHKPFGGNVRVTMMMRRVPDGWRIFHYAEAPLAPIIILRQFYENVAADGLSAIPPRSPS